MKRTSLEAIAIVLLLTCDTAANARQTTSERKQFDQTKARAEKGDVEAQIELAEFYTEGNIVSRDLAKAAKWHKKAAEQGSAKGQLLVGEDYANGVGVKLDKVEAVRWFRRAADAGLAEAQFDLGTCYANGDGVKENSLEAVRLYRQACQQNFVAAQYELGRCYLEGTGVAKNTIEGLKLVRTAAEKGFGPAQNCIGLCYAKGEGLPKDNFEAYKWFVLAEAQEGEHVGDIKVDLAKVERFLTQDQIAEAQRFAREFQPRAEQSALTPATNGKPAEGASKGVDRPGNLPESNKAPKYGWITLQAEDAKSEIFVDGSFVGNPPAKLKLPEGNHSIEVKSGGNQKYERKIMITEGCELTLTL